MKKLWIACLGAALLLGLSGCATNPATGQRQLSLIGEGQEIEIGRTTDQQLVAQMGLYPDEELQKYVQELGEAMAQKSERPNLPWTFRVLDDPIVNAFALPGGYIYVTRGILSHMRSEAELVGVLGHEIGHVTARHGVNQMSKAQLATLGLGLGTVLAPELGQQFGNLAQQGLGLLFLKFGRDAERQADDLGFRYASSLGHSPAGLADFFDVLSSISSDAGGRLPSWLSTHPDPDNRQERLLSRLNELSPDIRNAPRGEEYFHQLIDGITFGQDPRQGFIQDSRFYHPELEFQFEIPEGWKVQNQKQAVVAVSPQQDAVFVLTLAQDGSPEAAARKFFQQQGIQDGGRWFNNLGRLPVVARTFGAVANQTNLRGGVAFVNFRGRVYRLLGYTSDQRWQNYQRILTQTSTSFSRLTDREYLDVEPMRIEAIKLGRDMSLEEFDRRYPSSVSERELALINHVEPGEILPAGSMAKRVLGFNPAR